MRTLATLASLALMTFALAACAELTHSAPSTSSSVSSDAYCPDNASCLTTPDCTLDSKRECLACVCSSANGTNPGVINAEGLPPMR